MTTSAIPSEKAVTATADANDVSGPVNLIAQRADVASRALRSAPRGIKDAALLALADALVANSVRIVEANGVDVERERARGMSEGLLDRLTLTDERVGAIADALRELAALPDPVGEIIRGSTLPNGLRLRQTRVPMGVVGMIYEARPNVTVDAAGLCLKSGNAVILRGGSAAASSNEVIVDVLRNALTQQDLPADLIQTIDEFGRPGAVALMQARGLVDVLVPRGGANLIQTVVRESIVPVIETGAGNCHLFIDASANVDMAVEITLNSKLHRVGVCNAIETLLVHKDAAPNYLPVVLAALSEAGTKLHGDDLVAQYAPSGVEVTPVTEEDWGTEFLAAELAIRVVENMDEAFDHIQKYSTGHTEGIVTSDLASAERFTAQVDSAVVNVNASTRFTDGGQFGLGAEIGISTQKLHARGPMGLAELTTTKWIVTGEGQIRS